MNHPDLDDLELRANRMSDGMVVNRDKFAREVRALIREVRNWRNAHERAPSHTENPHAYSGMLATPVAMQPNGSWWPVDAMQRANRDGQRWAYRSIRSACPSMIQFLTP